MPINPDAVGDQGEAVDVSWTSKDALLYAVGIGAGTDELSFTTENTTDISQQVFPTFPVVIGWGAGTALGNIGKFDGFQLVHGTQSVTLHRPLPTDGSGVLQQQITGIYDKGKAAVVATETTITADDGPLATLGSSVFIRGEGGWGGDRGPSGDKNVPPDRDPDHQVTYTTTRDQALVYRLSGDRNPLHTDPAFASLGGFDRPILHGLCTYGFTGRALLHTLCGSDPVRFQHVEGRFKSPVLPGDDLTVSMWEQGDGEAVFTTSVGERIVLDQGLVRYS